ncbi:IS256 family transposase, partial [Aliidiomarina quisquiliarum]
SGVVQNKSVYLALGINTDGEKELLGLWMAQTEGAKFWLSVMNELKNRGVDDIFIACCDGLKGFPEAIEAVYPKTQVQLCIVHQIRHSLRYVNWKQRKTIAADLKLIYGAATRAEAEQALENFASTWDSEHPTISRSWRANWERLSVFFDYPVEIRKAIYTTNAIESLNASLRKITKTRRSFPNDEAVMKVLYLALHQASKKWTMPIRNWKPAMAQFEIIYQDRI